MSKVSIYLNFQGNTEEAFNFYKSVFKTEFVMPVMKLKDAPPQPGAPQLSDKDLNSVMPVSYTHLRAHETVLDLVCRLLLEKKKHKTPHTHY